MNGKTVIILSIIILIVIVFLAEQNSRLIKMENKLADTNDNIRSLHSNTDQVRLVLATMIEDQQEATTQADFADFQNRQPIGFKRANVEV